MLKNLKNKILKKIRNPIYPDLKEYEARGLIVGKNFNMQELVSLDFAHCYKIEIGDNVTLAPRVHILAHDASTKSKLGYTKIGLVKIGNEVFVGAGTIILPNVEIGDNVIIGAGSVITRDVPDNCVVAGNPAKFVMKTSDYLDKHKNKIKNSPTYNSEYTFRNENFSQEMRTEVKKALKNKKIGYLE